MYLTYVTPGKSKNTREVIKRIDFLGSGGLFGVVGSFTS